MLCGFLHLNVYVFNIDLIYKPDDFNTSQGPHSGHIYNHANVQRWKMQRSLRSSIIVQTDHS